MWIATCFLKDVRSQAGQSDIATLGEECNYLGFLSRKGFKANEFQSLECTDGQILSNIAEL